MDNINLPTKQWNGRRECRCGCDTFRFKVSINDIEKTRTWLDTICRNCNHTLTEHMNIVRSRQAE